MKKLLLFLALVLLASPVWAADLQWDYPSDWAQITGYVCYYNEQGQTDQPYHKAIPKADLTQNGTTVTYSGIEQKLNLPVSLPLDQTWDIWITAYNATGESGPSNVVPYTIPGVPPFAPPADVLPQWEITPIPGTPYGISRRVN